LAGIAPPDTSIVVFGSLARDEFTSGSDVDWTLLLDGQADSGHLDVVLQIDRELETLGTKAPNPGGTFGRFAVSHDLIHRIGGDDDTNRNTTQRILLLLESAALGENDEAYARVISGVLRRYVEEDAGAGAPDTEFRVPRFLLNDITRYWRTLTVDFAHKRRLRGGKGWALRTAKLRMSRKLIYAAGLLSCFSCETDLAPGPVKSLQHRVSLTVRHLSMLVRRSPLDITAGVLLPHPGLHPAARELFGAYDAFLAALDDEAVRATLDKLAPEDAESNATYRDIRDISVRFQDALTTIFFDSHDTPLPALTRRYGVF
ncbi:MAG TPA: nucleotidyltransferase domain-containing protein, partial [Longimicrobium sp.]|jgi:hypothetical protein